MISQKPVGRLQRLLTAIMDRPPRTIPLLSWPEYRTPLYEEGIKVDVLDYIKEDYGSKPTQFLPALHDGRIPAFLSRYDGTGKPMPSQAEVKLGQSLLLVFAAVAVRRALGLPNHIPEPKHAAVSTDLPLTTDKSMTINLKVSPIGLASYY